MEKLNMKKISLIIIFFISVYTTKSQNKIDGIVAVVGEKIILNSAIENQFQQLKVQGLNTNLNSKCLILEDLIYQKLLAYQAQVDSIEVSENEILDAINQRIDYFVSQVGSKEKLEETFGKSILELKDDYKPSFRDQILAQRMRSKITSDINVTPQDVKDFFNNIPKDSLPYFPHEYQFSKIVIFPKIDKIEKSRLENKLLEFKKRIKSEDDFKFLATLYSEDSSSKKGGELGYVSRGDLVPEFESVAFRLSKGEVSEIVKTKFGFHIIQLIDRKGEQINVRHILLKPKHSQKSIEKVKLQLDSIVNLIKIDSLSFEDAAYKFSEDDTKNNGGIVVNFQSGNSIFTKEEMEPLLYSNIKELEDGEISKPYVFKTYDERSACKVILLNKSTKPHYANLKDDYERIQKVSLENLKNETFEKWLKNKINQIYINIKMDYDCNLFNKLN